MEAKKMYKPLLFDDDQRPIGLSHINEQSKVITFPSGARSKFSYCEYDKHADSHYGNEYCKIYWDELQNQTEYQFHVLRSRNRSLANVLKGVRCTLNPDPNHFVYDWVKPFLDEDGFPRKELSGKTRYFVMKMGILHTAWDRQELIDKFKDENRKRPVNPQTYTYIPSTLEDNKVLQEIDPEYYDVLDSLPEKKRRQMLEGCWKPDEDTGMYFSRKWLTPIGAVPNDATYVRGWDLAESVDDPERNLYPDFTASTKMAKCKNGKFYICGASRFKERFGARDKIIYRTGHADGVDTTLIVPQDAGSAGKQVAKTFVDTAAQEHGLKCRLDPSPHNASKVKKFEMFSIAAENGSVYIVESSFDSPEDLELFYQELESFNGERSTRKKKDDWVDSTATAFNALVRQVVLPTFSMPEIQGDSKIKSMNHKYTHK